MSVTVTRLKPKNLTKKLQKEIGTSSLEIGARVASQAKALAPVDLGQLRNGISASNLAQTVLLNNKPGDEAKPLETSGLSEYDVYVGANVEHAIYQEYGTIKQPAQPFLRPAVELIENGTDVADIAKKYGRRAMKAALKERQKTVKKHG